MTYFTDAVAQIVADDVLAAEEKAGKLRAVQSQAADLLRAAGPAEAEDRKRDLEEIDQALAILFPSHNGMPNVD